MVQNSNGILQECSCECRAVAQLAEHLIPNQGVVGSIPTCPANLLSVPARLYLQKAVLPKPDWHVAYKKEQGRYARMAAFWSLALLLAYGCLGGFVLMVRGILSWFKNDALLKPWVEPFPIIGVLDAGSAIGIVVLLGLSWLVKRILDRPKVADTLIETESELKKVTWPTWPETMNGSIAVVITVVLLLAYLTAADYLLTFVMTRAMGAL